MNREQSIKAATTCSLLKAYKEQPFINYKWEELVVKLCRSENPGLRKVGLRELDDLKLRDPAFKIIESR
jgi:hypothetical protein